MENIGKCLAIALSELGKIHFSGTAVIPAGKAMHALYLAAQETERLQAEEEDRRLEAKEERPEVSGDA